MASSADDAPGRQSMLARNRPNNDDNLPTPYAQKMAESGQDPRKPPGGFFPMGFKEGFSQWWASLNPASAEHSVLSAIPYLRKPPPPASKGVSGSASAPASATQSTVTLPTGDPTTEDDPHGPRKWATDMVTLSGRNRALNEFSVTRLDDDASVPEHNLVMLHGYGAGLAFFYKNFEPLSRRPGWRLFALDLPGMGRSTRPPFKIHAKDREAKIKEAESWFVDALEEWRIKRRLERFTLLGHSLGGYMAVAYALKYPGRLEKLILASPVGIPEDPYAVTSALPDSGTTNSSSEMTKDQREAVEDANIGAAPSPTESSAKDKNNFLNARADADKNGTSSNPEANGNKPQRRPYPKWLVYLWDANISPFAFVRWSGPLGPRLVSGWTSRRFSHLPPAEAQSLHHYSYSLFRQRGSGEYALAYILAPGAFARSPLIRRIGEVGRGWIAPTQNSAAIEGPGMEEARRSGDAAESKEGRKENGLPVVFLYGQYDWMDVDGGHAASKKLDAATHRELAGKSAEERAKDNGSSKVVVVSRAGHHVYLDSPDEFNQAIIKEMEDVEDRANR